MRLSDSELAILLSALRSRRGVVDDEAYDCKKRGEESSDPSESLELLGRSNALTWEVELIDNLIARLNKMFE